MKNYYEEFGIDPALKSDALISAIREKRREWMFKQNNAPSDDLRHEAGKKIVRLDEFKKMALGEPVKNGNTESSNGEQLKQEQLKLEKQEQERQKLEQLKIELDQRKLKIDRSRLQRPDSSNPSPSSPEKTAQAAGNAQITRLPKKTLIAALIVVLVVAGGVGFGLSSVNKKRLADQKRSELLRQEQLKQNAQDGQQYQEQLRREAQLWQETQQRRTADSIAKAEEARKAASQTAQTVTDSRDGKTYRIVKIGSQTWMAENLNFNANGSRCHKDRADACARFGRLYDWNTAMSACPAEWRLPSLSDWQTLVNFAGGNETAGDKLKAKGGSWLKNRDGRIGGTDDYGFSALPGGHFFGPSHDRTEFSGTGIHGTWWTAAHSGGSASVRGMGHSNGIVGRAENFKSDLVSVRCIRN